MKFTFTLFCCLALIFGANAQTSVTNVSKSNVNNLQQANVPATTTQSNVASNKEPKPSADVLELKETEFDFGKIPQGKPVTHIFEFTNTGSVPFSLDNVQASCGCTTPEWNKDVVAPGATAKITVGYNAQNDGPFAKPVSITYNGSQVKQIIIKGDVWQTPTTSAPENTSLNSLKNE